MVQYFTCPKKEYLYDLLCRYYDSPDLWKLQNGDGNHDYCLYGVQLPCFLLNEKRYLMVLCPLDTSPVGTQRNLRDLRWISLQARSLQDDKFASLPTHSYEIKRDPAFSLSLHIFYRSTDISTYHCVDPYPLEVSLLHVRKDEYEYPNDGTLVSALESFQTILQWLPNT